MQKTKSQIAEKVRAHIREVPDFPIKGVLFKDISPLFLNAELINEVKEAMVEPWADKQVTRIAGIESRGFLLGPSLASRLDCGFIIVRKKGKLPPETHSISYALEYGNAEIELTKDSIRPGDKVVIHDDLLATGGTAAAAAKLVRQLGGEVAGFSFLINLSFLNGEEKLREYSDEIHYVVKY